MIKQFTLFLLFFYDRKKQNKTAVLQNNIYIYYWISLIIGLKKLGFSDKIYFFFK
jgi:hypothetical protein